MLRGKRAAVPGLFNKLSCLGVRLLTRKFASPIASRVLGQPRLVRPQRSQPVPLAGDSERSLT
jgi:hypothetical protein